MPADARIDRPAFFDRVRGSLFDGRLTQGQVDGMTHLLDTWDAALAGRDLRWLAYGLATTLHETAATMQPIRERGGVEYFTRMYDPLSAVPRRAALAKRMGAQPGDGPIFYGRGYAQVTWRRNYVLFGKRLGLDLTSSAKAAHRMLEPEIAARALWDGMVEGLFTGRKLADYFGRGRADWEGARAIINGTDRAELIAGYGRVFYAALRG